MMGDTREAVCTTVTLDTCSRCPHIGDVQVTFILDEVASAVFWERCWNLSVSIIWTQFSTKAGIIYVTLYLAKLWAFKLYGLGKNANRTIESGLTSPICKKNYTKRFLLLSKTRLLKSPLQLPYKWKRKRSSWRVWSIHKGLGVQIAKSKAEAECGSLTDFAHSQRSDRQSEGSYPSPYVGIKAGWWLAFRRWFAKGSVLAPSFGWATGCHLPGPQRHLTAFLLVHAQQAAHKGNLPSCMNSTKETTLGHAGMNISLWLAVLSFCVINEVVL